MNPYFSVVIPLYNKENYIQATLESVLQQSFTDFEIIIVNDGSTDNSVEKVKALNSGKIRIFHQNNNGASVARNKAIKETNGNYIALLDADDYWYENHLAELKKAIDKFPNAGLYATSYEILLNRTSLRKAVYNNYAPTEIELIPDYFSASIINTLFCTPVVCFRKTAFYEIGVFDENLRTAQDLDFFARAALKFPIAFNPVITMRYHKSSENNLAKTNYNQDRENFLKKFRKEERNNESLKKYLDINRYALVIRCKIIRDQRWKRIIEDIDLSNLSHKQKLLLKFPRRILLSLKYIQNVLIRNNIYLTAFK